MKKIIIQAQPENEELLFDFANEFPQLSCGWILRTAGDPITEEDGEAEDIRDNIEALISNSEDEDCRTATESDYEYVNSLLKSWNLAE